MKMTLPTLSLALILGSSLATAETAATTQPAQAARQAPQAALKHDGHKPRESFTEETIRKSADGKISKRTVEQKVSDKGFVRKEQMTNPEGKVATREVTASYDKDSKEWSRKVEGKDFDGKTWSRSQEGKGRHGKHQGQGRHKHGKMHADGAQ